ncbi:hypothetical protein HYH03_005053 [Edaphochlamys debaryana]|uniref:Bacterial repeat domain-containing protein n=1 Tax=Edaphochlamys debaryana TaxID=47281 RepID=A0A835Y6F0_9CHLO|nr:hypothetical protein HYH03_005053 [Edaphochlamys debaryana]|eukprot:KAG2497055.1 hypothetical protein HYH03_005053 [Edaphochlamys debaryana]
MALCSRPKRTNLPPACNFTSLKTPLTLTAPVADLYLGVDARDPDGTVTNVTVYAHDAVVGSGAYGVIFATSTPGNYSFKAVVYDNLGANATCRALAVLTVLPGGAQPSPSPSPSPAGNSTSGTSSNSTDGGNLPPRVNITSPAGPVTLTAPVERYYIGVTATDPDGSIASVMVYANGVAVNGSGVYGVLWSTSTLGNYTFTARATDNKGASTLSAPSPRVTVVAASNGTNGGGGGGGGGTTFVLTVQGGKGSGTYGLYKDVVITANAPPSGQVFDRWLVTSGYPQVATPRHYNTTVFCSSSFNVTVRASYMNATQGRMPFPVASHPRLMVTAADLPALRAQASASNPMWQQGLAPALATAWQRTSASWSWSFAGGAGRPVQGWRDTGGDSWEGDHTEAYAEMLAFGSLLLNNRTYALRAKDMLMWMINLAKAGHDSGNTSAPFASPFFATFNRASHYGHAFGLLYDWLQYWPSLLSPADKAAIRAVFLSWADNNVNGYMAPRPVGVLNSASLLGSGKGFRNIANNYASAHGRQLAYYALSFDPADDVPSDPWLPESALGNTVRSYVYDVTGAWLYQKYACMETPANVAAKLQVNASTPGLGECGHGGLPPEGFLYGTSLAYVHQTLQALHTAGWATPALAGPQIALLNSTVWGRWRDGFLHSLTPDFKYGTGSNAYMGQYIQMFSYGDLLRLYINPPDTHPWLEVGWWARKTGNAQLLQDAQWMMVQTINGGAPQFWQRVSNPWPNCYSLMSMMHYLVFNATDAQNITRFQDPRPSLPSTTFVDPALNRVISRDTWRPNATVFTFKASWEGINHQLADAGSFELYRAGEWLTNSFNGYAANSVDVVGCSSVLLNTLSIQNSPTNTSLSMSQSMQADEQAMPQAMQSDEQAMPQSMQSDEQAMPQSMQSDEQAMPQSMQSDEQVLFPLGSQAAMGYGHGGDPAPSAISTWTSSSNSARKHVAVTSDFTGLYNRPNFWNPGSAAIDVLQAVRSIVWIDLDFVVVYDRATTGRTGKFKRFNLNTVQQPRLAAGTGPGTTKPAVLAARSPATGTALTLTSLLPPPDVANVTVGPPPPWTDWAELEPTRWLTQIEDKTRPKDARFLTVLQATGNGTSALAARLVSGSLGAGSANGSYVGACFGSYVVMFRRDVRGTQPATAAAYVLPSGAPTAHAIHLLTGLAPGKPFTLTRSAGGSMTLAQQAATGAAGEVAATSDASGVARFAW